jgi:2,3-dihydro-2,3-dihydroxybenzoate dehydrogenase
MTGAAIVTGAAGDIGRAVVARLQAMGHVVAAVDRDPLSDPDAWSRQVDITDAVAVEKLMTEVEAELGPIDALVNGAGVLRSAPALDLTGQDWSDMVGVNLLGTMQLSTAVARRMVPRGGGAIVTIGSNAGSVPRMGMAGYCASKAAAAMFTRCLGLELAAAGVRCNIVAPGSTETAMLRSLWTDETGPETTLRGSLDQHRLGIPLGRIATPDDIAEAVAYLVSPAARQITMHTLTVDGGATLGA